MRHTAGVSLAAAAAASNAAVASAVAASSPAQLRTFCEEHGLVLTSIHDLREHLKAMPK